ncbi:hypothetical protein RhiJN_16144 [Ceratobasidium sp. AG-Ba]|nr:hypothetical protein RhiJN_16144 [Ceratobasidium sp. AG-Ba]
MLFERIQAPELKDRAWDGGQARVDPVDSEFDRHIALDLTIKRKVPAYRSSSVLFYCGERTSRTVEGKADRRVDGVDGPYTVGALAAAGCPSRRSVRFKRRECVSMGAKRELQQVFRQGS